MLAAQQREHAQDIEQHKRELLSALVAEQVIDTLGRPDELLKVQVRPLWQGHFRVNVLVGVDAVSANPIVVLRTAQKKTKTASSFLPGHRQD